MTETEAGSLPVLQVVIGSTRPGRAGYPIGCWIAEKAEKHGSFDVELVDIAEFDLPPLDEPHHPRLQNYVHDHARRFSKTIDRADAFAMVFPEYNRSFNGALKNAIDYLVAEWAHKPVGLVSYGGISAASALPRP